MTAKELHDQLTSLGSDTVTRAFISDPLRMAEYSMSILLARIQIETLKQLEEMNEQKE